MKVLFVIPPNPYPSSPLAFGFPLGLGYLASALKKHEVKIYDACFENATLDDVKKVLVDFKPHVLGITLYTALAKSGTQIAKLAKSLNPICITTAGGSHATYDAVNLLTNYDFDFVFKGDAEKSFPELLESIGGARIRESIPIADLDELDFPAYHLVDYQKYIRPDLLPNAISIMSSRGCSHRCAFCSQTQRWNPRSPENIAKEIDFLLGRYKGIQSVQFYDDNFTFDKERVLDLCNRLRRYRLLKWCCLARVDQVDLELLKEMKSAGCVKVSFGVESGSKKVLKAIHKGLDMDKARSAFKMARKAKLEALCFMMVGNPGETLETVKKSKKFALSLKSTSTLWSIAQVYPGTELSKLQPTENAVEYLYKPEVTNVFPFTHPCVPVFEKSLDRETLKTLQKKLLKRFLIHHSINNFFTYLKHFIHNPKNGLRYIYALSRR